MQAREKLNVVVVSGCLVVSALLGAVLESWLAFVGILVITVAACNHAEGIRLEPTTHRNRAGRHRRP